jgi:hypothetical protein
VAKPTLLATGERFATLRAMEERLRAVRDAHRGRELSGADKDLLLAVLARHPDARHHPSPFVRVFVEWLRPPVGSGRAGRWCFVAQRADGTRTPISLADCLRPPDPDTRLLRTRREAYRQAVSDQLRAVRLDGRPQYCPLCKRWRTDIDAHHVGETFSDLIARFEAGESAAPPRYFDALRGGGIVFRADDAAFVRRWQAFHHEHARLVPLCRRCHNGQSGQERKERAAQDPPAPCATEEANRAQT